MTVNTTVWTSVIDEKCTVKGTLNGTPSRKYIKVLVLDLSEGYE